MDSQPTPIQSLNFNNNNNNNELENSNLKTKKKPFLSEVDPHLIKRKIQQEKYIWFGVHNELLRNKNIIKLIQKCKDSSIPIERASIHLEKFKLSFYKNNIYLYYQEDSVIFLKLYLITKEQFIDILKIYYNCNEKIYNEFNNIFKTLLKINDKFNLKPFQDQSYFYDNILCVGDLDNINIFSVSTDKKWEIAMPDVDYLKIIYNGLIKSFKPYSEYLIMYYIYLLDGVRNFYTIKQLLDVFNSINNNNNNPENSSAASSETNMTIGENINQNKLLGIPNPQLFNLTTNNNNNNNNNNINTIENNNNNNINNNNNNINNTPPPNIKKINNDTVKCSTCNASPFIGTPEKDPLNQYSYIFDLHHLPIFDEITGEFFWSNNEANWKVARDSIIKSEEANNGKSMSIFHGSLVSLSQSFTVKKDDNKDDENIDNNEGTFIEELNNLLKEIN